jgi:hypothetical protein
MGVNVNFHADGLSARSVMFPKGEHTYGFATFDIYTGGNSITVFLRNSEDAMQLVAAAKQAFWNIKAIEDAETKTENSEESKILVSGNSKEIKIIESEDSSKTYTEDDQGNWHEVKESQNLWT